MELDLVDETRDKVVAQLKVYMQWICQAYNCKVIPPFFSCRRRGLEEEVTGERSQKAKTLLGRTISNTREVELGSLLSARLGGKAIRTSMECLSSQTLPHLREVTGSIKAVRVTHFLYNIFTCSNERYRLLWDVYVF